MSELAPGSMSLEEADTPQETPQPETPAPETPPAPQQAAPEATETDPDGTIEGSGGVKFVPLGAVVDLRGKVREKETALAAKDAEIAALKEKADKFDQVANDWKRVEPLIQQLEHGQVAPPLPKQAAPDPNMIVGEHPTTGKQITLEEYTRSLDLYDAQGNPHLERGLLQIGVQRHQAKEQTRAAVQPLYQNTAQQQSQANFNAALTFTDVNGVKVDKAILERYWNMVQPELSANPHTAQVLYQQAVSEMLLSGKYKFPTQAPPPPQHTESLGGNTTPPKELTPLDRSMMGAAQIKTKDYETISANFKPGQSNALE